MSAPKARKQTLANIVMRHQGWLGCFEVVAAQPRTGEFTKTMFIEV
jgi:hypothetical protein